MPVTAALLKNLIVTVGEAKFANILDNLVAPKGAGGYMYRVVANVISTFCKMEGVRPRV